MLVYVQTFIRFYREISMTDPEVRLLMRENGFGISNLSRAITQDRKFYEYDLVINYGITHVTRYPMMRQQRVSE